MKNKKEEKEIELLTNQQMIDLEKRTKIYLVIGITGSLVGGAFLISGLLTKNTNHSTIGFIIAMGFMLFGAIKAGKKKSAFYQQTSDWCLAQLEQTFGDDRERKSRQYIESFIRETNLDMDWDMFTGDSFKMCQYKGRKFFIVNFSLIKEIPSDNPKEQSNFQVKLEGIYLHSPIDKDFSRQTRIDNEKLQEIAGCEVVEIAKNNFVNVFIKTNVIFGEFAQTGPNDVEGVRKSYMDSLNYMRNFVDEFFKDENLFVQD